MPQGSVSSAVEAYHNSHQLLMGWVKGRAGGGGRGA